MVKGKAAFIDVEHALDPNYAQKIGVILEQLIIVQPDSGEQALGILEVFVKSNAIDLIVIDSVAALTPPSWIRWWNVWSNNWCASTINVKGVTQVKFIYC